jgi:hypothetical protein
VNRRSFLAAAAGAAASALARSAAGAQIDQVHFQDQVQTRDKTLTFQGAGLVYHNARIKIVAAALYLDRKCSSSGVLADVPKRLEMEYFRRIQAQDLIAGSEDLLARNVAQDQLAVLRPQIDAMHGMYRSLRAGDRCSLTYLPDVGTWLTLNGQLLGTIAGAQFAAAYFSIWFGHQPMDAGLKRKLLGRA